MLARILSVDNPSNSDLDRSELESVVYPVRISVFRQTASAIFEWAIIWWWVGCLSHKDGPSIWGLGDENPAQNRKKKNKRHNVTDLLNLLTTNRLMIGNNGCKRKNTQTSHKSIYPVVRIGLFRDSNRWIRTTFRLKCCESGGDEVQPH